MAVTFTATPEPEAARIRIDAQGGVAGDRFYMIRRDRYGSSLIRETSEIGALWQSDPALARTNLAKNPGMEAIGSAVTLRTNTITNPSCEASGNQTIQTNMITNPSFESGLAGWATGSNVSLTQSSTQGLAAGKFSASIRGTSVGINDTFIETNAAGTTFPGITNNTTYTLSGTVTLPRVLAGSLHARFAKIVVFTRDGSSPYVEWMSNAIPNAVGSTRVSVTLTTPPNTTEFFVRLYNGADLDNIVIWDAILMEQSGTLSPYFDGSSPYSTIYRHAWTGVPNASRSTRIREAVPGPVLEGGAQFFRELESPISGLSSGRLSGGGNLRYTATATAGQYWTFSADYKTVGSVLGTPRLTLTQIGGTSATTTKSLPLSQTAPGRFSVTIGPLGAGATQIQGKVFAPTSGGEVILDSLLLEEAAASLEYFDGDSIGSGDISYGWTGDSWVSTSVMRAPGAPVGAVAVAGTNGRAGIYSTTSSPLSGSRSARMQWFSPSSAGSPGIQYRTGKTGASGDKASASVWVRSSVAKPISLLLRFLNGGTTVGEKFGPVVQVPANVWTQLKTENASATGSYTDQLVWPVVNGTTTNAPGDTLDLDRVIVEASATVGEYFDGSTGRNHVWTGAANASTSVNTDSSFPSLRIYDYEARQGLEVDYILTNEEGVTSSSQRVSIPKWGTWLKDPFRPFMNVKILWNSDSKYSRKVDQSVLKARGAKFPVVQSDRRMAPSGVVRLATQTQEEAKALVALLDSTSIVLIDVDIDFGVPVRYVSVGDVDGSRIAEADRDLGWAARYWDLPIQEIDMPLGSPISQSLTYDSIPASFGSYIAIPASVATYNDLAGGNWGNDV